MLGNSPPPAVLESEGGGLKMSFSGVHIIRKRRPPYFGEGVAVLQKMSFLSFGKGVSHPSEKGLSSFRKGGPYTSEKGFLSSVKGFSSSGNWVPILWTKEAPMGGALIEIQMLCSGSPPTREAGTFFSKHK